MQELKLRCQITPSAIKRNVMVKGITATIFECNQTRMWLRANQVWVGDSNGIRANVIAQHIANLLLAPSDAVTVWLVEPQNRLTKLAARKLAKPITGKSGKLNLWLAFETRNHKCAESA